MQIFSTNAVRKIFKVFNFLFILNCIMFLGIGSYMLIYFEDYMTFLESKITIAPIFLIVTGATIFFAFFTGCCGAKRDSLYMMYIVQGLLVITLLLNITTGSIAIAYEHNYSSDYSREIMNETFYDSEKSEIWDKLQEKNSCCGINGPNDWLSNVPESCIARNKSIYQIGCLTRIDDVAKSCSKAIYINAFEFIPLQVGGLLVAYWIFSRIKKIAAEKNDHKRLDSY